MVLQHRIGGDGMLAIRSRSSVGSVGASVSPTVVCLALLAFTLCLLVSGTVGTAL